MSLLLVEFQLLQFVLGVGIYYMIINKSMTILGLRHKISHKKLKRKFAALTI